MAACSLMTASGLFASSTEPLRSVEPALTVNPPQTSHPIYYPMTASGSEPETGIAPEALLRQFMQRHTAMDYPAAAEAAMRLAAAAPDRPEGHYNLACALSRLRRIDEALRALELAIDCGWRDLVHTTMDPDLASVRGDGQYDQLIAKLREKIQAERIVPAPLRTDSWQAIAEELQVQTPVLMKRYHVPGAAIALVRDGQVVWTGTFGVGDRRSDAPLLHTDRFRLRAPLHLLVIVAAQQQQDRGRLNLGPLLWEGAELDHAAWRVVSSGARLRAGSHHPDQPRRQISPVRSGQSPNGLRSSHRLNRPSYAASSVFGFLKLAIEISSGQSFTDYCRQHIIDPLHMSDSGFAPEIADQAVKGHSQLGSPMDPDPASDEITSGGALHTTAGDLAQLMKILMAGQTTPGQGDQDHRALSVAPSMLEAIDVLRQVQMLMSGGLGLALDIRRTDCGTRVEVADASSGCGCLMRWYPAAGDGVVVIYNSATGAGAAERIAHLALGGQ